MGALTSRQNAGVEEVDIGASYAYRYPPKSGNYFSSHFIMGGERFETPQPEAYLFGENSDLNFLGSRPSPFPYPAPQANEPTKTLRSLVNIRKESLRFIKTSVETSHSEEANGINKTDNDGLETIHPKEEEKSTCFNIEFTFDSDCRCAITIYYFCTEEVTANGVIYTPRNPAMNSETYHYKKGANQQFTQVSHVFDPSKYSDEDLNYSVEREVIPVAIQCIAEDVDEPHQSHSTIAIVEGHFDGSYVIKALKQRLFVDGLCYLLQEIYGIENKNGENTKTTTDDDTEDNGSECVICMCDIRDTLILPCRHLCLCNSCADSLRYQANNCPICRAPFRALLQIRALQKMQNIPMIPGLPPPDTTTDNIPAGYEAISLIEALNGPFQPHNFLPQSTLTVALPILDQPVDATTPTESVNEDRMCQVAAASLGVEGPKGDGATGTTPEICMSVMTSLDPKGDHPVVGDCEKPAQQQQPFIRNRLKSSFISRDTVTMVNEVQQQEVSDASDCDAEAEERSLLDASTNTNNDSSPNSAPERIITSSGRNKTSPNLSLKYEDVEKGEKDKTKVEEPQGEYEEYFETLEDNNDVSSTAISPIVCKPRIPPSISKCAALAPEGIVSLPGTPQSVASQTSHRSSGDSFSSTSSTRQLLPHPSQETLSEDKTVP